MVQGQEKAPEIDTMRQKITTLDILTLRVQGYSYVEIAQKYGCSKQCVDRHLQTLCPDKSKIDINSLHTPRLSEDIISGLLPEIVRLKGDAHAVSLQTGVDETEIRNLIYFLCAKRRSWSRELDLYPAINNWCKKNLMSKAEFANAINISETRLMQIIHGNSHMDIATALKIQEMTGLSMAEIFAKQIVS